MDLVSVIIPAYNSEKWIEAALRSVLVQTYRELEVIVIDDGSVDQTAAIAERTLGGFSGSWKVLRQPNAGVSVARNNGWRAARGTWIQFLDSDDYLSPDKISLQMAEAQDSLRDATVFYSSWQRVAEKEGKLAPMEPVRTPDVDGKSPASLLITKNVVPFAASLVRRERIERARGFNEQMRVYEDDDLMVRLAMGGGLFRYVPSPGPVFFYRMFPDQPRWGDESARYKLKDVVTSWLGVLIRSASNGRIDSCGLSPSDRDDLLADCTMFLRSLYVRDRAAFRECLALVQGFIPGYAPKHPRYLWLMSKCIGYERAEDLVAKVRPLKRFLGKR